jgi:hypothetical protein
MATRRSGNATPRDPRALDPARGVADLPGAAAILEDESARIGTGRKASVGPAQSTRTWSRYSGRFARFLGDDPKRLAVCRAVGRRGRIAATSVRRLG